MLRRFSRSQEGNISVEFAFLLSFVFVPMLLGIWDVAQIGFGQEQVQEALQDTVTYVAAGNTGSTGITSAAQAAYGTSISVNTSTVCYCVKTTTTTPTTPSTATCGSSCSSGYDYEQFMNITVSKTVTIPFTVPYLGNSLTVSSNGKVRTG
ncbi:MAG TPA: TadE/TadG family type IV pilus assembly protein [Methylovirgula sp.]|jgi:Flp pilus assembly protein TadG